MVDGARVVVALVVAVKVFKLVVMPWTSVPQSVKVGYSAGVNCLGPPIAGHFVTVCPRSSIG